MPKPNVSLTVSSVQQSSQVPATSVPQTFTKIKSRLSYGFSRRFNRFPDLPPEVRALIWEASLPGPRVHELHPLGKLQAGRLTFRSNASKPPVALHVCRESRHAAQKHYILMDYDPQFPAKPIRKFYYDPLVDTLFLNTLTGLYMTLILLEDDSDTTPRLGIMRGWRNVAFDADRAHLVTLLSGMQGRTPRPHFQRIFPDLRHLTIAFDFTSKGKTRFRTSIWPGEDGTSLVDLPGETTGLITLFDPIQRDLKREYGETEDGEGVVDLAMKNVKRKVFVRGNIRYGFRKGCAFFGITPRGVFRWL